MNLLANPSCNSATICTTFTSSRSRRYRHGPSVSSLFIANKSKRRCEFYDLHDELVPYADSWLWQKAIVKEKKELIANNEDFSDTLIILQHPPVYTLGTGSSEKHLRFSMNDAPFDIYRTDRGGEVTYHGPGDQKLAAIGVKVSHQCVTYHGLALNITTDLSPFNQIVPCGIQDRQVGTLKGLLPNPLVLIGCEAEISHQNYDHKLIDMACKSLVKEFSEVFQVELCLKQQNPLLAASG